MTGNILRQKRKRRFKEKQIFLQKKFQKTKLQRAAAFFAPAPAAVEITTAKMIQIARKKKFLYILLPADFIYKHVSYIPRIAFMILPLHFVNMLFSPGCQKQLSIDSTIKI